LSTATAILLTKLFSSATESTLALLVASAGEQRSTVFKDTRELAKVAAGMVDTVVTGTQPEINDTKTYNNGVKVVPSFLLKPVLVDKSNYKEVLIDSGYYKSEQLE
jgi:putative multiple sugar transport system substrate-binding protein